ncbi:DUF4127 family protein [Paenibacillus sp. P96]|uniref:DUF4127 family protein n=1 Tax=Paenibacillus zeirhizosphaerae TaxID=2987519 RepID=A0ABT9FX15_9BACL|nr:DUF4127 family protein [Paenibacillus sp. P96]MDP4099265.1 DUF4127 family protein [Paenibacillus sp. P96]
MEQGKRILFMPLDERPCNYEFPYLLAKGTDYTPERPPLDIMGHKKTPGDPDRLWAWLEQAAAGAHGAVLALDTLLYGGIVPSRLHGMSEELLLERLMRLRDLKIDYPDLKIYAFQLIMRCPQYSSADEEPDYYEHWGREIFRKGFISHRRDLQLATEEELAELEDIELRLPPEVLDDYLRRRAVNAAMNKAALELVAEGIIDFLIIPQDDSAPFGYTARDQEVVRWRISELELELSVYMYPGADEVGCTLFARMVNTDTGRVPLVYPRLSSLQGAFMIPLYEDRYLYETLKYQVLAAGGLLVPSAAEADMVLLINAPGDSMAEAVVQGRSMAGYDVYRNITELAEFGAYMLFNEGKPVAVADVGYANGGDLKLIRLLRQKNMLFSLAGYAGWNTSSNTLGTVIAQSMLFLHYGQTPGHLNFLALRYTEDVCYCSLVRTEMNNGVVDSMGLSKFWLDGERGQAAALIRSKLNQALQERINGEGGSVEIVDCYMPWNRTFEVGLTVSYHPVLAEHAAEQTV